MANGKLHALKMPAWVLRNVGTIQKPGETGWMFKPLPTCGPDDVIGKVIAVAYCTTDISTIDGAMGQRPENLTLGHECLIEIWEKGENVHAFEVGDKAIVPAAQKEMRTCRGLARWDYSNHIDGVFSQNVLVKNADDRLAHLPEKMKYEVGLAIGDVFTTGKTAVDRSMVKPGDTALVVGATRSVGLSTVACLRHGTEVDKIYGVGSSQAGTNLAKKWGADEIIDYNNGPVIQQVKKLTGNNGVDVLINTGAPAPEFAELFNEMLAPGGRARNVGYFNPQKGDTIPLTVTGTLYGMGDKTIGFDLLDGGAEVTQKNLTFVLQNRNKFNLADMFDIHYGPWHIPTMQGQMRKKDTNFIKTAAIIQEGDWDKLSDKLSKEEEQQR